MENLWQSMKKFSKELWQTPSNVLGEKRNYIKEIEETIETFRFMSEGGQKKNFKSLSLAIENYLVEGDFDNKIRIKYLMRFITIIKINIFLPKSDAENCAELRSIYLLAHTWIEKIINELHGVERIKENSFLNILSHEDKVDLNDRLMHAMLSFRESINQSNNPKLNFEKRKNFATATKNIFVLVENKIKKIIGDALQKITEQEKINRLKMASDIFKEKAKGYRGNSWWFLGAAVILPLVFSLLMFSQEIFGYEIFKYSIKFPQKYNANRSTFYIYLILETLLRGRLLLSLITLTGFFYCLRFYAASNHNAIICDQRANTLESFESLYENVEEDKERLLVVEKVLHSATEHLPTGFSKQQSDGGGIDPSNLLSVFKRSPLR